MLSRTEADRTAVRRAHRRHAEVTLHYPSGPQGVIPVEAGSVTFSLTTGQGNRRGSLTVPGYEWWDILRPRNYGWVDITVSVDGVPFGLGEFPIVQAEVDRPRGTVEVTLGDWAYRRALPHGEVDVPAFAGGMTVKQACELYMGHTTPGGVFTVTRDDSGGAAVPSPIVFNFGGNVWTALTGNADSVCGQVDCQLITTSRTTGQIRRYSPNVPAVEDLTGTVIRESLGESVTDAVNRVIVEMESSDPNAPQGPFRSDDHILASGPYAYSRDGFGMYTLTANVRQPWASSEAAYAAGNRLFLRQAGMVQQQRIDIVPQPWIQLGDCITWTPSFTGEQFTGLIETFNIPLTAEGRSNLTIRGKHTVSV